MAGFHDYNGLASNNTSVAGKSIAEGMARGNVSDVLREVFACGKLLSDEVTANTTAISDVSAQGILTALIRGQYPSSARTAVPRGVTGYSSLVGGAGGTNGTFALSITGGGGASATGTFTVVGGIVTLITITGPGYGYTSAPTFGFAASAGLTGASATAVIGDLVLSGQFYFAADGASQYTDLYQNVAGVATPYTPTLSIPTKAYLDAQVLALNTSIGSSRTIVPLEYVSGATSNDYVLRPRDPLTVLSGDGTQYMFVWQFPFDTLNGHNAAISQRSGAAWLPLTAVRLADGTSTFGQNSVRRSELITVVRNGPGDPGIPYVLRYLAAPDFVSRAQNRVRTEVGPIAKSPSPDRPVGFGRFDANSYLVKMRPHPSSYTGTGPGKRHSDEIQVVIFNMSELQSDADGAWAFNSLFSRFAGGTFEHHFNQQLTESDSGLSVDTGLVPSTIESVPLGGNWADRANSATWPAQGYGHGYQTGHTLTAVLTRNDLSTGNVDVAIDVRSLTIADGFRYGDKLVTTASSFLQSFANEIWCKATYKLTYEPTTGRQIRVETSFDATDAAVTITPAIARAVMIGGPFRDVNRCASWVAGVRYIAPSGPEAGQQVFVIDKGNNTSTLLGYCEKAVFWHTSNPRRQIIVTNVLGYGTAGVPATVYSHWEDTGSGRVNIPSVAQNYVQNFDWGNKFYAAQAFNQAPGTARNLTGVKFGADYTFEVVDADPIT